MIAENTLGILGGDLRSVYLAAELAGAGYTVLAAGLDNAALPDGVTGCNDWRQTVALAQALILPLPVSTDGVYLNAPLSRLPILLDGVLSAIGEGKRVLGGQIGETVQAALAARGHRGEDYFCREEVALLNAVPTAEGAVQLAMEELPVTLAGSRCLITGYGRVAQALSRVLCALHAEVTVAARSYAARAAAVTQGCRAVPLTELTAGERYDCIFNTVPARLFTRAVLETVPADTLIIDLASRPGGVDFAAASELHRKTVWALSLPGRVAPRTAGRILRQAVEHTLEEGTP